MAQIVRTAYKLAFETSPILFTGGQLSSLPIPALPIAVILEGLSGGLNLLGSAIGLDNIVKAINPSQAFATFTTLSGGTLVAQQIGAYPVASQAVAANTSIEVPLQVSLSMKVPVGASGVSGGYAKRSAVMTALKLALDGHIASGGLFTVLTPSYIYEGCLLTELSDISGGSPTQAQEEWRWTFQQPLTQEAQIQQVLNNLMGRIAGGLPTDNLWSSAVTAIGAGERSVATTLTRALF